MSFLPQRCTTGIVIGILYGHLTLRVFPLHVSWQWIDPGVFEAARPWRIEILDVPALDFSARASRTVAGCIVVWVPASGEYVIPQILGGGKT